MVIKEKKPVKKPLIVRIKEGFLRRWWLYIIIIPLTYLITTGIYFKAGKREGTSKINNQIKKIMFSKAVLFGETLIVKGIKTTANNS